MTIYTYATLHADGSEAERFEIEQSPQDPPLTHHPITHHPITRIYEAPALNTQYTESVQKRLTDPQTLQKAGFTQYRRDPLTKRYHKEVGTDPQAPESF